MSFVGRNNLFKTSAFRVMLVFTALSLEHPASAGPAETGRFMAKTGRKRDRFLEGGGAKNKGVGRGQAA